MTGDAATSSRDGAELFRALAVLCEPPEGGHAALAEALGLPGTPTSADYTEAFLLQAYPYASIYLGPEGMMGGEARDRVAGFWRALGLVPPPEPDHLGALLGLFASLADAEHAESDQARALLRRSSRRALLWEHLLSWCPPYLAKVSALSDPVYAAWAQLLSGRSSMRRGRSVRRPSCHRRCVWPRRCLTHGTRRTTGSGRSWPRVAVARS